MSRLHSSHSEGRLSTHSRLSDSRREKLVNLKRREDLKGALTEKFKGRFGRGATQSDERSVASDVIRREVDTFAKSADVTEANLGRLERRLQNRARATDGENASASGVSAYSGSGLGKSRSAISLGGQSVIDSAQAPQSFEWSKLDDYAMYLNEQDALRQRLGVAALQRKLRMDLDQQVKDKQQRRLASADEEQRYHQNTMIELERWKQQEQAREEERHMKLMREKSDRDQQLAYERKIKSDEEQRKRDEEALLVNRIVSEMDNEQLRLEKRKEKTKKSMKKVFAENAVEQERRLGIKKQEMDQEQEAMREYNRVLDEQEAQRAAEMEARLQRQALLMKKLQVSVLDVQKAAGDNDEQRAAAQQEEQDRHFFEAEKLKQRRLQELRQENQSYLLKQMDEKESRRQEDRDIQAIQAVILERDSQEYGEIEQQKVIDRRVRNLEHRKEIEKQMDHNLRQAAPPDMSPAEIAMNKPLLNLVNKTLEERDKMFDNLPMRIAEEEDEDY
mmetsp:Transcript_38789/g.76887  ORF Transcript_38789/g.76887 Transcript_38789/m.76887 type:complete len:504 (-) Transcript_38789:142-1653(-)